MCGFMLFFLNSEGIVQRKQSVFSRNKDFTVRKYHEKCRRDRNHKRRGDKSQHSRETEHMW